MSESILNVIEEALDRIEEILTYQDVVTADKIGLDIRAGRVYVTPQGIIVREGSRRSLEYYGGFEYVDRSFVITLGDITIYTRDDDRVDEAIRYYMSEGKAVELDDDPEGIVITSEDYFYKGDRD